MLSFSSPVNFNLNVSSPVQNLQELYLELKKDMVRLNQTMDSIYVSLSIEQMDLLSVLIKFCVFILQKMAYFLGAFIMIFNFVAITFMNETWFLKEKQLLNLIYIDFCDYFRQIY